MSRQNWQLDALLMLGFGAGLYTFFKGFRIHREYRVLEDTPEVPIRSVAMGLVHVHGAATGGVTLTAPVTHSPCFFYKVDIEKWERDRNRSGWRHYRTDTNAVRFYLEDSTGKVLVDSRGAEHDLVRSGRREIGSGFSLWRLLAGRRDPAASQSEPTEQELRDYVASGGFGQVLPSFPELTPDLTMTSGGAQMPEVIGEVLAFERTIGAFERTIGLGSVGAALGRFRFTEYCIAPGRFYTITGTCAENPNPKDEHDRNLIVKGESEPTFLISWKEEKQIESGLRWRALLYIFGGAALAVVSLYLFIVLVKLGWI